MTYIHSKKQKFVRGDVVRVAKDLGPSMAHFRGDADAVVVGSYRDQYGGDESKEKDYTIIFCDDGCEVSWYWDHQLTFIRRGGEKAIVKALKQAERIKEQQSDLDWILAHWKDLKTYFYPGVPATTLMQLIGIDNPWPHGEGWELQENWEWTKRLLSNALDSGDKAKVIERAEEIKKSLSEAALKH